MLISNEYRELNEKLHKTPHYGVQGGKWFPTVLELMGIHATTDVLDYGAGKQSLKKEIPTVTSYDPAIPEISRLPDPHDIVVCTDVLEHIEPDYLEEVLLHIFAVMKVAGMFVVSTRKAKKELADGRNAHLIVESFVWWMSHIKKYFNVTSVHERRFASEFVLIVTPKRKKPCTTMPKLRNE